jgi:hypothetical protein
MKINKSFNQQNLGYVVFNPLANDIQQPRVVKQETFVSTPKMDEGKGSNTLIIILILFGIASALVYLNSSQIQSKNDNKNED